MIQRNFIIVLFAALQLVAFSAWAGPDNYHRVTDDIYRSGRPDKDDYSVFKGAGIRTILSLEKYDRADDKVLDNEERWTRDAGMTLVRVPMSGIMKPSLDEIDEALDYITDPSYQPILVHCHHGSDRTGIVIAAYRIRYQGWTIEKAEAEMRKYHHNPFLYWWDNVLDEIDADTSRLAPSF